MSSRQPENERDDAEIPAPHGAEHVTPSIQENMSASLDKDGDPPKSPKRVQDGCDDGKGIDGDGPNTRQNDGLRSEMVDKPSLIQPPQSTPPGDPVNDTEDPPDQPLATVESFESASLEPGPGPEPLQLRPLCSIRPSSTFGSMRPVNAPISWQKDRKEREEKDRAAMDKLWKADR
ncbi:hypothetical protein FDENT_5211 [Fusarium denticulatum]|uniref:Uncharacterized protein n=1 Tax=Fusarium denticulatum TaxID=48507 RepID=A0A8H5UFM5_9HYPO|nr:hypothetical protein FDENT_5211 [Fusarium denticulatum]